jgi:hypothetical protein
VNNDTVEGSDVEDYERLRERALRGDAGGWRLGLAVVERRGVAAWLRVRAAAAVAAPAAAPAPAPARAGRPVLADTADEIVSVLAAMALGALAGG